MYFKFSIGQIGKAFRNEITPGNFTFRTIEFEQMEYQTFCKEGNDQEQYDYFNHRNIVGFTRLGDYEHPDSGLAVVMSDARGGAVQMNVGKNLANTVFYDCTGNLSETVYVDNDGNGIFYCKDGSVSVWIKQGQSVN